MSGKKPTTIFTDQDAAMAKAISIVMSDVCHGLCTFHLNQNALKHLGHLFKANSNFGKELNTCIFGYEVEEELVKAWDALIERYNLHDNTWMNKTWDIRNKWAHVYMKWSFNAGMRSTQLSESLNARIKKSLKSDLDIVQFFTHFDAIVVEKRYEESKAIYDSREKLPRLKLKKCPLLIQVAELYTPPIFDIFHDEVDTSLSCKVKQWNEFNGQFNCAITMHGEDVDYVVVGSVELDGFGNNICQHIRCTCRKFESFGILCSHAIKGLDRMSVMEIPKSYILRRWRLDAKSCELQECKKKVVEDDPKLLKASRFRMLCPRMVKLATQSCELEDTYLLVDDTIEQLCRKVDNMILRVGESFQGKTRIQLENIDKHNEQVKGLKKKKGIQMNGRRRLKPWHEKNTKKRKFITQPNHISECLDQIPAMSSHPSFTQASCKSQFSQVTCDPVRTANSFLEEDSFLSLLTHSEDHTTSLDPNF